MDQNNVSQYLKKKKKTFKSKRANPKPCTMYVFRAY